MFFKCKKRQRRPAIHANSTRITRAARSMHLLLEGYKPKHTRQYRDMNDGRPAALGDEKKAKQNMRHRARLRTCGPSETRRWRLRLLARRSCNEAGIMSQ